MRSLPRRLPLAATLFVCGTSLAHSPAEGTALQWYTTDGGQELIVRTNRGVLVHSAASGRTRFICNEAYGASGSEVVPFERTALGVFVASYAGGLALGRADLCHFEPVDAAFRQRTLASFSGTRGFPTRLYALTLPTDTDHGELYASDDGGRHFTGRATTSAFATSLVAAPSDPEILYVAQLELTDPFAPVAQIAVSGDGGRSFRERALVLEDHEFRTFVLAVDARDPSRVFARTQGRNATDPERLLASSDGGKSWQTLFVGLGPLSLAIEERTGSLFLGARDGLYRSEEGPVDFRRTATRVERVGCLTFQDGALYACAYDGEFGVFISQDGAKSLQPYLRFRDVRAEPHCPVDSQVATRCREAFDHWNAEHGVAPGAPVAEPLPQAPGLPESVHERASDASGCAVEPGAAGKGSCWPILGLAVVACRRRWRARRSSGLSPEQR